MGKENIVFDPKVHERLTVSVATQWDKERRSFGKATMAAVAATKREEKIRK